MDAFDPGAGATDETQAEMLRATYAALRTHGYAALTIQHIGAEFPKSKSLIYQHYDSKDELLVDFLEHMLDRFEARLDAVQPDDPQARLRMLFDQLLATPDPETDEAFIRTLTLLRGQAPANPAFRAHFTAVDAVTHTHIVAILEDGIDAGVFQAVDPDAVATTVLTMLNGALLRWATTDESPDIVTLRQELDRYLAARLGPAGLAAPDAADSDPPR